ncbi:transmembrane protein 272-like [Anthonomus grandis grandis]|uniref:transmembrane protein 272-like n=1 Tax=Anthonomus grandis grandis TaxID=2921223 RepID=UPI002165949C|nr:transmembrane protein 272-like [Anthonomus grandis grandis]
MADNQENLASYQNEDRTKMDRVKEKVKPGVRITLIISLIFALIMFIVGIYGVHKCRADENIPFFLIVIGGIGVISKACSMVRETVLREHAHVQYAESSLYTVELVFLLLGSYWVFKEYQPNYDDPSNSKYCNKTVYMFAFVYLIVMYAVIFLIATCFCCFLSCIFFVAGTAEPAEGDNESPSRPINPAQNP